MRRNVTTRTPVLAPVHIPLSVQDTEYVLAMVGMWKTLFGEIILQTTPSPSYFITMAVTQLLIQTETTPVDTIVGTTSLILVRSSVADGDFPVPAFV